MGDRDAQKGLFRLGKERYQNYCIKKRPSPRPPKSENDIYINTTTNLECQVSKCHKLFEEGNSEVIIHGLGAAVKTAVNVALILQERLSYTVDLAVNTSTVKVFEDYYPLVDEEDQFSVTRSNSAVHIRVSRKPNF